MDGVLVNFHLPFLIIALVIGFQISLYFLYLYFTEKHESLELNKILLAYGLLHGFIVIAILIRTIYTYYILNPVMKDVFFEISHIIIAMGAIVFLYIIRSSDAFNKIINKGITTLVLVSALIISALIIIFPYDIISILLIMTALGIGGLYLSIFQLNLIRMSTGDIKKRLKLITLGDILMILGIFVQADEFILFLPRDVQIISMVFSAPILIIGELIVFLGLYQFPAFLEFDWRKHMLSLYIVNWQNLTLLYHAEFDKGPSIKERDFERLKLKTESKARSISRGLVGIDQVISQITQTEQKKVAKIRHENSIFIIKHGGKLFNFLTYLLLVDKDMKSFEFFLDKVKESFEENYKSILLDLEAIEGSEMQIFSSFDPFLQKLITHK